MIRKAFGALCALALLCSAAVGQGVGQLGAGQVWGNPNASQGVAMPATLSAMFDRAYGSTRGAILERGASGWVLITPGASGLTFKSNGAGADPAYGAFGTNSMPAFGGGDVSCAVSGGNCTIANNAVTNAKMATAGAATIKGNPTAGTANDQDFTIQGLTARGTPNVTLDKLLLFDNAAGTFKYVTPTDLAVSIGTYSKIFNVVTQYGAVGDGITNNTTAIQNAINDAQTAGGVVYFPQGNYCVNGGLNVPNGPIVRLQGAQLSTLSACGANVTTLTVSASFSTIQNLVILGPQLVAGAAPTGNALTLGATCVSCTVRDNLLQFGANALLINATDVFVVNNVIGSAYGTALVKMTLSGYLLRNKIDQAYPVSVPGAPISPAARANTTGYTTGTIVSLSGFYIQATNNGTSGGSPPTLQNYNANITDGTVTWKLVAPTSYCGMLYDTGTTQSFAELNDYSGPYTAGICIQNNLGGTAPQSITIKGATIGQTLGQGIFGVAGGALHVEGSFISQCLITGCGGIVLQTAFTGDATLANNTIIQSPNGIVISSGSNYVINANKIYGVSGTAIFINANISGFSITSNSVGTSAIWGANGAAITVTAGTSNHYYIDNNDIFGAVTGITDNGSGTDKRVQHAMPAFTIKGNNTGSAANELDLTVQQASSMLGVAHAPEGRLTLQTGVPVMTTSTSGATTVFYTPYIGRRVPIFDGTNFVSTDTLGELSQTTTDTTKSPAAVAASSVYDIFVWNDAGTIRATRGPAWTNDTTRSSTISLLAGVYVNTSSITNGPAANRGTYVGTIRSNGSSTIDFIFGTAAAGGGLASHYVWNMYNRVMVRTTVADTTATWTYSTGTARSANNSNTNRINFLSGVALEAGWAQYFVQTGLATTANSFALVGWALDATNTFVRRGFLLNPTASTNSFQADTKGGGTFPPQVGAHFIQAVEQADGTTTTTFSANSTGTEGLEFLFPM